MRWLWPIVVLLPASPALAYVRSVVASNAAACLFWTPRTVHAVINQAGSSGLPGQAGFDAIAAGFGAWGNQSCSDFAYALDGPTPSTQVGYSDVLVSQPMLSGDVPNLHLVVFRDSPCAGVVPAGDDCLSPSNDDCDNKYDCWPTSVDTGGDALAYTVVTSVVSTGEILDADTAFDEADFEFKDLTVDTCDSRVDLEHCADVQNTMTHEAGHFLGLAHSSDPTASMYGQVLAPLETSKRAVAPDDVAGLCAIYPAGQPPVRCVPPPPTQVTTQGCSCGSSEAIGLAWCVVVLALRRAGVRHPN